MESPQTAIKQWNISLPIFESSDQGLINGTWMLGDPPQYVLQWVNPIFSPLIHEDLLVITEHLHQQGYTTPRLIQTSSRQNCWEEESGCWRVWSYIPGKTIHKMTDHDTARIAGGLVGTFHRALSTLEHTFIAPKRDFHNTPERMKQLRQALEKAKGHPLEREATALGEAILQAWKHWDGTMDQPLRICHGDLKISNLRFSADGNEGICLIDLDTIGAGELSAEMGDAWRSWCNPVGESNLDGTRFDVDIFEHSVRAWLRSAPPLLPTERESLVGGIERICLELSARFCADALQNSYFKENRRLFPQEGQHNYIRALGQFRLAQSAKEQRSRCEEILRSSH